MIVRRYLHWMQTAPGRQRADATRALAAAYLERELAPEERREALAALMGALDDPSPDVRRALADVLGASDRAPRALIVALAQDQPDIALLVLGRSPMLQDPELVDALALGDGMIQAAVALRPHVSRAVAAALAEVGEVEALVALAANPAAEIAEFSLLRMAERHGDDALLRESLLARGDLGPAVRLRLTERAASHLTGFAARCGWLSAQRAERLERDAREAGTVIVAAEGDHEDVAELIALLCASRQLTPQLLLRSVLSGHLHMLEAALSHLTGLPATRVRGLVKHRGAGFVALYRKAGLPAALEPAFTAALDAHADLRRQGWQPGDARLSRGMVEHVLASCAALERRELDKLLALLARFQAEAARLDARDMVADMLAEPPAVTITLDDLHRRLETAVAIELAA